MNLLKASNSNIDKLVIDHALNNKSWKVRKEAVGLIKDQSVLEHIALNDESVYVIEEAIRHLTNQSVLESIVLNEKDWFSKVVKGVKLKNAEPNQLLIV